MGFLELCMKRYHKNCNYAYNMFMVYWLFFFLLAVVSPVFSEFPSFLPYEEPENIIVHNRILAKVNGKTISVIDVMKKMDLFLQRFLSRPCPFKTCTLSVLC